MNHDLTRHTSDFFNILLGLAVIAILPQLRGKPRHSEGGAAMLLLAMLLLAGDEDVVTTAVETFREKTRADVPCRATADQTEVIVCARRDADRYRVPLVPAGSTRNSVPLRTAALLDDHAPACGQGAFLVRCGSVGVSVTMAGDGSVHYVERELAP